MGGGRLISQSFWKIWVYLVFWGKRGSRGVCIFVGHAAAFFVCLELVKGGLS